MKEINFKFEETPKLNVNGHVFELQLSDADIFDRALRISEKYQRINENTQTKQIIKAVQECAAIVDEILGAGAMRTIADGKPVSLRDALRLMAIITNEAVSSYETKLKDYE